MKTLLLLGLMLGLYASVFAQTEESMCVSVTNATASHWDSTDHFIPSGQQISKTYFHYKSPDTDGVRVDCYQVNGDGSTGTRIWTVNNTFCGCGSSSTIVSHPISGNQTIRLRVYRTNCPGYSISGGTSKVHFYTSATAASCPPQCQIQ
ncbi:MAG: hypothetical protein KDB65_00820 [Calditrichaeota bacterium]|nr:hypothetical protein [Calditrichota bacterium]MCB9369241.1 hypothetical protein [Calditrichota bacterium]